MPLAPERGTSVDKEILDAAKKRATKTAARAAGLSASVASGNTFNDRSDIADRAIQQQIKDSGLSAVKPGPMFRPEAIIDTGRVRDDTEYGRLLGRVFGDTPIRSDWNNWGMSGWRDNGVLAMDNPESWGSEWNSQPYGSHDGNVYGDRTGDYTQTGNSKGPVEKPGRLKPYDGPGMGMPLSDGLHTTIFGLAGEAGGGDRRGPGPTRSLEAVLRSAHKGNTNRSGHYNPPVDNVRLTPSDVSGHYNPPVDNVRGTPSEWNTGHENPVPAVLYGPGREDKLERIMFKKDARQAAKAAGAKLPLGPEWREQIAAIARRLQARS